MSANGDAVVVVKGPEPDVLYDRIRERFGASPVLVDGSVRMTDGQLVFDDLVKAFPDAITSICSRARAPVCRRRAWRHRTIALAILAEILAGILRHRTHYLRTTCLSFAAACEQQNLRCFLKFPGPWGEGS